MWFSFNSPVDWFCNYFRFLYLFDSNSESQEVAITNLFSSFIPHFDLIQKTFKFIFNLYFLFWLFFYYLNLFLFFNSLHFSLIYFIFAYFLISFLTLCFDIFIILLSTCVCSQNEMIHFFVFWSFKINQIIILNFHNFIFLFLCLIEFAVK